MSLTLILTLFIILELFESTWQRNNTFYGLIQNNFSIYKKNIFLYFLLHATFFYALFIALVFNIFNFYISSIIILKFFDIVIKISIMKKLSSNYLLEDIMPINFNMTVIYSYFNLLLYPFLLFMALSLK